MAEKVSRTPQFDRFLTFIDAIVAIAITLLVLPLVDMTKQDYVSAIELIAEHSTELFAFTLSFVVILQLWWSQHEVLADVTDSNRHVVQALSVWVFTIVVLPFSTALATYDDGRDVSARALYIGNMAASSLALAALAWAVSRIGQLKESAVMTMVDPLILLFALTVAVAVPATGYYPLLLFLLTNPITKLVKRLVG